VSSDLPLMIDPPLGVYRAPLRGAVSVSERLFLRLGVTA